MGTTLQERYADCGMLKINSRRHGNIEVISCIGDIDMLTVPQFYKVSDKISDDTQHIVVDAKDLKYISAEGVRAVVNLFLKVRDRDGGLSLVSPSDHIKRVFRLFNLDDYIPFHETIDEISLS